MHPLLDPCRLAALDDTGLLDAEAGEAFDRFIDLATVTLSAPIAMVNLVDARRQVTLREIGLPGPMRDAPLERSICHHLVRTGEPLVVPDVRDDPRTARNPAVDDYGVASYAGVPLRTSGGLVLGSFCVLDTSPRHWTTRDVGILRRLSDAVMREVEGYARVHEDRLRNAALAAAAEAAASRLAEVSAALTASEDRIRAWRSDTVARLARATELRSEETGTHITSVSRLTELIALDLGMPAEAAARMALAAALHDVGKIAVPDAILHKPGRLSAQERAVMETHAEVGFQLLSGSGDELLEVAAVIARTHHERVDGAGYPRGLAGSAIPIEGRIVAVADVFDALINARCYRPALPIQKTLTVMREGRGTHFDPPVLDALLDRFAAAAVEGPSARRRPLPPAAGAVPPAGRTPTWEGPPRRALERQQAVQEAAHVFAARLAVPAVLAERVLQQTAEVGFVPGHVVEQIALSPEAAVRVLLAAAGRPEGPWTRVHDAVRAIGRDAVRRAFSTGEDHLVVDPMPGASGMSRLAFTVRSSQTAIAASRLVPKVGDGSEHDTDAAWTAGLLHDVGAAVLIAARGGADAASAVLGEVAMAEHPLVGAWLARGWQLHPDVVRAIRCHEDPRPPTGVVARAVWLAARVGEARAGTIDDATLAAAGAACAVSAQTLQRIVLGAAVAGHDDDLHLTPREREVLLLLGEGLASKQIAAALGCTASTVRNHLHNIYGKLRVTNQAQALLTARRRGLV